MNNNTRPLYQVIAATLEAARNCERTGNTEWMQRHIERIDSLVKEHMPSGSGFDSGAQFETYEQIVDGKPERLVIQTSFHHMNDGGFYDGWTDHDVIVTPSLAHGFSIRVTGKNRNDIKDYIAEVFHAALSTPVSQ